MNIVQNALIDSAKLTAAITVFDMVGGPKIQAMIPQNNRIMGYVADGVGFGLVSDGVDYISGEGSEVLSMRWGNLGDDMLYFGGCTALAGYTGMTGRVAQQVSTVVPADFAVAATKGVLVAAARLAMDYIDQNRAVLPQPVVIARYPVSYTMSRLNLGGQ